MDDLIRARASRPKAQQYLGYSSSLVKTTDVLLPAREDTYRHGIRDIKSASRS